MIPSQRYKSMSMEEKALVHTELIYHLHQLQQELATAQAKGDYINEQRVIAVLDGLTSGQLQVKGSGNPASRAQ